MGDEVTRYKSCLLRQQIGRGNPWENAGGLFQGRKAQRGFGFGSLLSSVGKLVLPLVKNFGKKALKQGLKQAIAVGKDIVLEGKKPKEALKTRGKALVTNLLQQTGSGRKRKAKWTSKKQLRNR